MERLYEEDRLVEAFYLAGKIVTFAIRLDALRTLLNAPRVEPYYDGSVDPIQIFASMSIEVAGHGHDTGIAGHAPNTYTRQK